MRGQILKGHLDYLILASVEAQPAHGYGIIQQLRRRSGGTFDLPEGTVYPVLHRLEKAKLLASRWEEHAGRRRLVYELTKMGEKALKQHRDEWTRFSGAISAVLEPVS